MLKITIGADPEVFIKDKDTGKLAASQGIVKGTKTRPFATEHGFVHRDNVLAEMNVKPASNGSQFVTNMRGVMNDLTSMLAEHDKVIDISSSHMMDSFLLQHFEARSFGCHANENCWDIDLVNKPNAFEAGNLRTASGHIHIGCKHTSTEAQIQLAKACEIEIGLPSISRDKDSRRRKLYGIAGSFRPKEYGIEYTVPSNFWLATEELMHWVFHASIRAVQRADYGVSIGDEMMGRIQDTINNCDTQEAIKLCDYFDVGFNI